jgi:eukaryotic-like serine/threonine-protein kinase
MIDEGPPLPEDAEPPDHRLDAVIAAYLQARDEGRAFDRQSLLVENPDLADALNRFFESDDQVEWLVTSVVPAVAAGAWFGPYRVVRRISRGGMGVVYEAIEPTTSRRVALKVLSTLGLPDPVEQERFRREIDLASKLDHAHIVPILEFGAAGGIPYCTMELIEGQDLRSVIRCLGRAVPETDLSSMATARAAVYQAVGLREWGLSAEALPHYWRFVAQVGSQAARALAHAHSREIFHRDIKPSNLLLDVRGDVHVADFGLARTAGKSDLTETGDLAGTLRYLAPERLHGGCGPWSDIYSLGLTLYELLVLRPAFETIDRSRLIRVIAEESPRRPRAIKPSIPRDLESIVLRAIEKEPSHRYPTADAMADDLDRFLTGRPILGKPVASWRRAWSWARRNPRIAGALTAGCLVLVVAMLGIVFGLLMSRDAAEARASEARAQREAAEAARHESQYQSLVLQLQQIRLLPHSIGWSERARDLVLQAGAIRADAKLRDQAAATFAGVDARVFLRLDGTGASSVAFNGEGKRLLLGGLEPDEDQDGRAKILDLMSDRPPSSLGLSGPGPVTFRDDGTPLQLVARPEGGLVLWDLERSRAVARFDLPAGGTPGCLALRPDGSTVAASLTLADGHGLVLVWDVQPCRLVHQFSGKATALAFAKDGDWLAAGEEDGRIRVWALREGERIAEFSQGRNTIHGLCFTRNPHRDPRAKPGWLLASGDSGGSIVVWDLATHYPISRCNGSPYNVYGLAFSPDGTTLASAGRAGHAVILWEWATARRLLSFPFGSPNASLAFSPDGRRLAVGQYFLRERNYFHVFLFDLEPARGIRSLGGLTAPVQSVLFSPDGRKLAALSHDWRLAVWDVPTGRLDAILDAPKGYTADNAGLAFSADSRRIAACAGREAKLWDLASEKPPRSWPLPPGLLDRIAFPSSGQLLVFRRETRDGVRVPYGNDFKVDPTVVRVRDLLGPVPLKPIAEFRIAYGSHLAALAVRNRSWFIHGGSYDGPDDPYHGLQAIDGVSGKELWAVRWEGAADGSGLAIDHSEEHLLVGFLDKQRKKPALLDVSTGKELRSMEAWPGSPGPDWKYLIRESPDRQGVALCDGDGCLLANLGIDRSKSSELAAPFNSDGKRIAWGNLDGSVMVAELEEIQSGLARAGLNWPVDDQ